MNMLAADLRDETPEPGDSFVLTSEGWQRVEYTEPEEGWRLRKDGAFESPDGLTRTWPIDPPTPE